MAIMKCHQIETCKNEQDDDILTCFDPEEKFISLMTSRGLTHSLKEP